MPPCPKCKGELCKIRRVVGPEDAQVRGVLCLNCGYSETWSYGQPLDQNGIGGSGGDGRQSPITDKEPNQ